ncbi:phospholipid carrier-dependent glycosyltransferase [Curtobacterium sp. Csp2]|uniref:phospholipid carrier-dependent glycosyltransferase n=1 Tax=Curtobacterium sp. Csp2 TaxID=2495430 RepID=UPI00157FFA28|nr:phospholipid carrier-dependent glycosyltransferase [Curtobacterium sp. Csp2]QKS17056.1 phospholipid carrier-dependent glycosyltransferase [Curtobacterium sp. Csp2]
MPSRRPVPVLVVRTAAFAIVALLGAYVALRRIGRTTRITDEITYVNTGWDYVHGVVTANLEHPPTAKYLFGLAQLMTGQGVLGPRVVVAVGGLVVGLVLFLLLRRPVGYWGALAAAGLWWLTPRGNGPTWYDVASGVPARIDRIALLDPVMTCFAVVAVAAAWQWMVAASDGRSSRWWWAALAGAALALSATSKVSTAVLVLPLLLLPVLFRRWRDLALGGVLAAGVGTVVAALLYLPVGGLDAIGYMVRFQTAHDTTGHLVTVLGRDYLVAPWWTGLLWAVQGIGWPLAVVLGLGVLAALVVRPDRLVVFLALCLGVLVVFYSTSAVALPHYYYAWMPFVVALAAVGGTRLARLRPPLTAVAVALVLTVAVVPVGQLVVAVSQARATGYAVLGGALADHGYRGGSILFVGAARQTYSTAFRAEGRMQGTDGRFVAIVEDTDPRFPMTTGVAAVLRDHPHAFDAFRVDQLRVWVVRSGAVEARGDAVRLVP